MSWTPWRKIADRLFWYTEHLMRIPVCYELALADPQGEAPLQVVYAGSASSEHHELQALAAGEHALSARIQEALGGGKELFYRADGAPTPEAARGLLQRALAERAHPWADAGRD